MIFTLVSSTTQPFDVNKIKLGSIIKIISAQSNLVDYERALCSSQFVDCKEVNDERISSCALSSQQSSCSMSWMHACLEEVMAATASGSASFSFW